MPVSQPTLNDLPVTQDQRSKRFAAAWPRDWSTFFTQIWQALQGWTKTYTATKTFDFGNINAQTQATTTVAVMGAVLGDAVIVRPTTAVNGIILDGTVTAAGTVTIRAVNYSAGAVDPASQVYRVIVFSQ